MKTEQVATVHSAELLGESAESAHAAYVGIYDGVVQALVTVKNWRNCNLPNLVSDKRVCDLSFGKGICLN